MARARTRGSTIRKGLQWTARERRSMSPTRTITLSGRITSGNVVTRISGLPRVLRRRELGPLQPARGYRRGRARVPVRRRQPEQHHTNDRPARHEPGGGLRRAVRDLAASRNDVAAGAPSRPPKRWSPSADGNQDALIIDFGPGVGIWFYERDGDGEDNWFQIHSPQCRRDGRARYGRGWRDGQRGILVCWPGLVVLQRRYWRLEQAALSQSNTSGFRQPGRGWRR